MALRILVVDDNELVRSGLCMLLKDHPGWQICGEAEGGMEAIQKSVLLKPDVILLDISMPDINGFQAAERIHERLPTSAILIVTENDSRALELAGPQPGVTGYVMKSCAGTQLVGAVEAASANLSNPAAASV